MKDIIILYACILFASNMFANSGQVLGNNPKNKVHTSGELWIQKNALLITRTNNRIENYGKILIDGGMRVKKFTRDAFKNEKGGQIIISITGKLIIKP